MSIELESGVTSESAVSFMPKIIVSNREKQKREIQLTTYRLSVSLRGFLAKYSAEMTFYNPHSREMEGNLEFPLPEGVSISGYALDINSTLVDACCVTKEKGRVVLETEERKRVDPGLVEWTKGNVFNTRIYPLPARGERTVRVDWVCPLDWDAAQESLVCRVPLCFDSPVSEFELSVEIPNSAVITHPQETQISGIETAAKFQDAGFTQTPLGWKAQIKRKNFQPVKDAVIQIPHADLSAMEFDKTEDGVYCSFAVDRINLQTGFWDDGLVQEELKENPIPTETITVFWDCSASRSNSVISGNSRELAFLNQWLKSAGTKSVRIVPVRNTIMDAETVRINQTGFTPSINSPKGVKAEKKRRLMGNTVIESDDVPSAVLDAIESLACDGATDLSAITQYAIPDELSLLFTDGFTNWNTDEIETFPALLYVFSSDAAINAPVMRAWALRSGGQYASLRSLPTGQAVEQFNNSLKYGWEEIPVEGYNAEIFPRCVKREDKNQYAFFSGKIQKPYAEAVFQLDASGRYHQEIHAPEEWFQNADNPKKQASDEVTFTDCSQNGKYPVRTFFAQSKLAELIQDAKKNKDEILQLGKNYSLVTPETSLIVLESLEQYLQHNICPPESLPKMRLEYFSHQFSAITNKKEEEKRRKKSRLKYISKIWKKRIKWWKKDYTVPDNYPDMTTRIVNYFRQSDVLVEDDPDLVRFRVEPMREFLSLDREDYERGSISPDISNDMAQQPCCAPFFDEENNFGCDEIDSADSRQISVSIKPWSSHAEYNARLNEYKDVNQAYEVYRRFQPQYKNAPSFYLECANWFHEHGGDAYALRILSNLAELNLEDPQLLRSLGHKLEQWDYLLEAKYIFQTVLDLRPEEPQSWRDLALVTAKIADNTAKRLNSLDVDYNNLLESSSGIAEIIQDLSKKMGSNSESTELWSHFTKKTHKSLDDVDKNMSLLLELIEEVKADVRQQYAQAIELLSTVILGREYQDWDERFPEIELFALEEINQIIPRAKEFGIKKIPLSKSFITPFDVDLRVVMTWHADNTDIDLHVIQPDNDEAYFENRKTKIGGLVSCDYTDGYGPEEYLIRKGLPGTYEIRAKFFGSRSVETLGEVCVQADVFTNFGRPNQACQSLTLYLKEKRETVVMGTVTLE